MKKILTFIFILSSITVCLSKVYILRSYDPDEGHTILLEDIQSSSVLGDKYKPMKMKDGSLSTAWCEGVNGPGIGEWVKFDFAEWYSYERLTNVYRILIVNGLAANKAIYYANNRVKKLEVEFSEGEKRIIALKDGMMNFQKFQFDIRAKWVKLKILDVYKGSKFDDTCISEVRLETFTHPSEMTPEERKRLGYDK